MKYPIVFLAFLTLVLPVFGQNADYSEFQVGQMHVNDFKVSPDGKLLLYNVVSHNSIEYESEFYIHDLANGTEEITLGKHKGYIQGWQDNEHVVITTEEGQFIIQNIFTKKSQAVKNPAPADFTPLYVSSSKMVFCDEGINSPEYRVYENGSLSRTLKGGQPLIINSFDNASNSVIEVYPGKQSGQVDVYQFDYAANSRKVIASLPLSSSSIIVDVNKRGDDVFYVIEDQTWNNEGGHLWKRLKANLYAYNMSSKNPELLYQFEEGMEALNLEIVSREQYLVIFKDHYNDGEIIVDRNEKGSEGIVSPNTPAPAGSKEIKSSMFAAIAGKFRSTLSASSIISTINRLDKDYPNIYINGSELAKSMSHLSAKNQAILSSKVDKLIINEGKVTVKLKPNVTQIKITQKSKSGSDVTVRLKQGATIKFTEKSSDKIYAQIKGTAIWMKVQYASIGAISLKGEDNTMNVFTKMGVGFWTSHKMGIVKRRVR